MRAQRRLVQPRDAVQVCAQIADGGHAAVVDEETAMDTLDDGSIQIGEVRGDLVDVSQHDQGVRVVQHGGAPR